MKTSIIIPFLNRWDLTHQRLFEIYKHVPVGNAEIVLIDDASTDADIQSGVAWWQGTSKHPIRYYRNPENLGFGGSMNNGAKIAMKYQSELLIFHSNDVIASGDFFTETIDLISRNPNVLLTGELIWWDSGWNTITIDGKKTIFPYGNGWYLACTSEVWKNIGGFDLNFGAYDYEDIDISATAIYLGYNIVALNSKYLRHIGGATISALGMDRSLQTNKNRLLFEQKWRDKIPEIQSRLEKQNVRDQR